MRPDPAVPAACVFGIDDEEGGPRRIAYLPELVRLPSGKVDRRGTADRARSKLRPAL